MALSKKSSIPAIDLSDQVAAMKNNMANNGTSEKSGQTETASSLKDIPAASTETKSYIPTAEYGQNVTKTKKKADDDSALIGFRIPKAAKEQYIDFFKDYGLNISEASKNALEYFIEDIVSGKVEITLTRHYKRVEK